MSRPRARDLGLEIGTLPSGPLDAITDVGGVRVGSLTLIEGDAVRTGVTVVVPHDGREALFAGTHRLNGNGELTWLEWIREAGSIIILCATDAPLLPHQCERLAQRCALGIGRTSGAGEHSSGDLVLAFSTVRQGVPVSEVARPGDPVTIPITMLADAHLDQLFYAAIEATEGAIVNALLAAETMTGRGGATAHALGADRLLDALGRG